ncbi:MAG TPA: alpha-ketoacid dehydrogenase subunit beta [Actinomycetota bacterium]|jgi:2-oxoisovalerate dehydrogenase E1 component beta subunit|nr:alpha-ketoacid dehydrogenase subunit beta [Actinomycetota bacterium]
MAQKTPAEIPESDPAEAAKRADAVPGQREESDRRHSKEQKVEAGAAGHGAEGRGTRNEAGEATFLQAISEALWEEMEQDERVFIMGEDIGVYGGAFKVTEGFFEHFGKERIMDTPIAEETIIGAAIGAAFAGLRPIAELQYADFIANGFDELVNVAGKYHYRSGHAVPIVVRGPSGGGVRGSAFHSQSPEPWFAHTPGLKVIVPAFPYDAKGLLKAAIRDDNPVVYFEHKWIYRRIREVIPGPDEDYTVPIGQAKVQRNGDDLTIATYGAMVHRALEAAEELSDNGISVEVVDLRTVQPLDTESVLKSVEKTSRLLVLYESHRQFGIGSEVSAAIAEEGFELLDAPIVRLAPPNTPWPFSPPLEDSFMPQVENIVDAVQKLSKW